MKVLVVVHGRAKKKNSILEDCRAWESQNPKDTVEIYVTSAKGDAFNRVRKLAGPDTVISCGGDGTNNEVINGLMRLGASQRPALAIYPIGSGNDFARLLPSRSFTELLNHVGAHDVMPRKVDVLCIRTNNQAHYALNMITCGIGAEIAASVNRLKFKLPAAFNYYRAIISWLMKYKAPTVRVKLDNQTTESSMFLMAYGNGTYAGNGLGLNPQSSIDDGTIGVTLIGNVGVIDFLRYQSTLKRAEYVQDPRLNYLTSECARLEVLAGTLSIETDGEVFARLGKGSTASISCLPSSVSLY